MSDLAEFYANCSVTQGMVTSEVNGKKMCFDARKLGDILGVPATDSISMSGRTSLFLGMLGC